MTIGELIDALKIVSPDARVLFDFCACRPTVVRSWRGVYAEAALGWSSTEPAPTVAELTQRLEQATDGRVFSGWKGGDYRYTRSTTLHVDNQGECTDTEIRAVLDEREFVYLLTECRA